MIDNCNGKSNEFGLFSGKYDSTRQRAVLLQGDRLRNYRRYNSTMRVEMLLAGGVIVTDAQFYDGLYFAWMTDDVRDADTNSVSQLVRLLEFADRYNREYPERKIFCIKQRTIDDYNVLAGKMFYKRWLFSSLESRELANFINEIGSEFANLYVEVNSANAANPANPADPVQKSKDIFFDAQEKIKGLLKDKDKDELKTSLTERKDSLWKQPASLADYQQEMLGRIRSAFGDVYDEEWERFCKRLTILFTEAAKTEHVTEKWDGVMGYHQELKSSYNTRKTYRDRFQEIFDGFRTAMSQLKQSYECILKIETEIDKEFPNRSEIEMQLDEIMRIADTSLQNDAEARENCIAQVTNLRSQFEHLFNDRYNKGLAMQHHARFIDVCDYPQHTREVIESLSLPENVIAELSQEAVIKLGLMSWEQFGMIALDPEVLQAQELLRNEYKDSTISIGHFNETLCKYLQLIETKIDNVGSSNWKVSGGPWDYNHTNMYRLHDAFFTGEQPSFIGGGSFIEGGEANEECLYRECEEGMCIHRVRIENAGDPKKDKNYDTILAPVQNVFNGKKDDYQDTVKRIDYYLETAKRYPNVFDNSEGQLEIILDRDLLLREQQKLYEKADAKGVPRSWYDIGVISEDPWVIFLRDLVRFDKDVYGGYTRLLNKRSALERTGKDVVVLVSVDQKLLVMRHFRHEDRSFHWECPRGFGEAGLSAEENARKEVYEETGYQILSITQMNNPEESVSFFRAECSGQFENHDQAESIVDTKLVTRQEFEEMIRAGLINDGFTIKAYTLANITNYCYRD